MPLTSPSLPAYYPSIADAIRELNSFAATEGYAIVKRRTNAYKGVIKRVDLKCDKGCKPRHSYLDNDDERQRNKSTRLTDCPFSVQLYLDDNRWRAELRNGNHNHTATDALAHSTHRHLSPSRRREIERLCDAGIAPRQTQDTFLQEANPPPITLSDINNARFRHRALTQGPRSSIQALVEDLQSKGDWFIRFETDSSHAVQRLLFGYQKSIDLLRKYPEVLLLDCTYNTNKFNMPLFTITGVTSMKRSFTIGMAFLGGEQFEEFRWVLCQLRPLYHDSPLNAPCSIVTDCDTALMKAIKDVFPVSQNLLCLWHIFKCITTHCKSAFFPKEAENQQESSETTAKRKQEWKDFTNEWYKVVQSRTYINFNANWDTLCEKYQHFPIVLNYLRNQWLPLKTHFVHAWTNQQLHFNTRVTSRAEGIHSNLKQYLLVNTGDLRLVQERVSHFLTRQIHEHYTKSEQAKTRYYWDYRGPLFNEIRQFVTPPAMLEILKQKELTEDPLKPCSGQFRSSMGLPCNHELNQMKREGRNLHLSDIYEFWHHDRSSPLALSTLSALSRLPIQPSLFDPLPLSLVASSSLQNPPIQARKGRPRETRKLPKTSTRRHLSQFELIDIEEARATKRPRQKSPSPPLFQGFSEETRAVLASLVPKEKEAVPDDDDYISPPRPRYETPPDERAAYELERTRREAAGGRLIPSAWTEIPELAGMREHSPRRPDEEYSLMQVNHPFDTFGATVPMPASRLFNPPLWARMKAPNVTTPENPTRSGRVPTRSEKREAERASLKKRMEERSRQKATFAARNARRYDLEGDEVEKDGEDE